MNHTQQKKKKENQEKFSQSPFVPKVCAARKIIPVESERREKENLKASQGKKEKESKI